MGLPRGKNIWPFTAKNAEKEAGQIRYILNVGIPLDGKLIEELKEQTAGFVLISNIFRLSVF